MVNNILQYNQILLLAWYDTSTGELQAWPRIINPHNCIVITNISKVPISTWNDIKIENRVSARNQKLGAWNWQLQNFETSFFPGWPEYNQITTVNIIYLLKLGIISSYNIEVKKSSYSWNWHLKKFLTKILGVLRGDFWGFVSKGHPNALLAKTMDWEALATLVKSTRT